MWRSKKYDICLSNVVKLKSQVSRKNNTQIHRYSKSVLKYDTQVNLLSYCPPLLIYKKQVLSL